jgi:hypothetical protein
MIRESMRRALIAGAVILMVFFAVCGAGCDDAEEEYWDDPHSGQSSSGYSSSGSSSGPGYLYIWTSPAGASVYVNGQYLGETNGYDDFIIEVPGGASYKVEIYKDGYEPYLENVMVWSGETRSVNAYLQQISYNPYYTPEPTYDDWGWDDEPDDDGPICVAATRPVY